MCYNQPFNPDPPDALVSSSPSSFPPLTVYDVDNDVMRLRVSGVASVATGILRGGALDEQPR